MQKSILVNIQIDNVTAKDLADIEDAVEKALKNYPRISINYNIVDQFGQPLPVRDNGL